MRTICTVISISLMAACSSGPGPVADASHDAVSDTSVPADAADSGFDAGRDSAIMDSGADASEAGFDAGLDATIVDAGPDVPTCACSTGACCDGCNFRPSTYVCAVTHPFPSECAGSSTFCGGKARRLDLVENEVHCSGSGATCNGATVDTSRSIDCYEPTPGNFEQYGVCLPPDVGAGLPARCAVNCGL